MFLHNYHTHTKRCHHATGEDREYVETAIKKGFQTLGFSDHAPYILPVGNESSSHRIFLEDAQDYADSIHALAKEYKNDIRILFGYELEYYPDYHLEEVAFLKRFSPDYFILGQHFIGNEKPPVPSSSLTGDIALTAYVTQVIAGLQTGDFLYLAHPDVAGYRFSEQAIQNEYRRLCLTAKKLQIPLEINLLGVRQGRYYPDERFFKIASEVGNEIVIGADAHAPQELESTGVEQALEMVKKLGLNLRTKPLL